MNLTTATAIALQPYTPTAAGNAGAFLAVEGVSGTGKSTVCALLGDRLAATVLHVMPPGFQEHTRAVNAELRPLPQLAFYLAGLAHASDLIRSALRRGNVVTDRYTTSVLANHTAVNGPHLADVQTAAAPFLTYVLRPTMTAYLAASPETLAARMLGKPDVTDADRILYGNPDTLDRVLNLYRLLAAADPTGVWIDTDDREPADVAEAILKEWESRVPAVCAAL